MKKKMLPAVISIILNIIALLSSGSDSILGEILKFLEELWT